MRKIVITDAIFGDLDIEREVLASVGDLIDCTAYKDAEFMMQLKDADAVLNTFRVLTPEILSATTRCGLISRYGIGVDTIPLGYAREHGIRVANVPDYCVDEVADHTMLLTLAVLRRLRPCLRAVELHSWSSASLAEAPRIRGKTLGIVGFGHIGRAVAERAQAFGFEILIYDPFLGVGQDNVPGRVVPELGDLLTRSDVLTLHAPLNHNTFHMFGKDEFELMKRGAVVVNVARGGLIDTAELIKALKQGLVGGAGLDVLEHEPPTEEEWQLHALDSVVLTPHVAYQSAESSVELRTKAALNIKEFFVNGAPLYEVL